LFCDLEKAADCVNCGILLYKLTFDGITKLMVLTESYRTVRHQTVITNTKDHNCNMSSSWGQMKHCVLQGSIVGSLLFVSLDIIDLQNIIHTKSKPDETSYCY